MSEEALCLHARLNTMSFSPPGFYTNLSSRNNMAYRNTDNKLSPRAGSPRKVHRGPTPSSRVRHLQTERAVWWALWLQLRCVSMICVH
jgi:hypothetical protein